MSIGSVHPAELLAILPELALVVLAGVVMTMDVVLAENRKRLLGLTTAVGSFVIMAVALLFSQPTGQLIWGGMIRNDMVRGVALSNKLVTLSLIMASWSRSSTTWASATSPQAYGTEAFLHRFNRSPHRR